MRLKQTARKSGGRGSSQAHRRVYAVWHPLLIAATDEPGRQRLFAGLAAKEENAGAVRHCTTRDGEFCHPGATGACASPEAEAAVSPFPLASTFGLLPYAAYRGHEKAVEGLCAAGFSLHGTAQVGHRPIEGGSLPPAQPAPAQTAGLPSPHGLPWHMLITASPPLPIIHALLQVLTVHFSKEWAAEGLQLPSRVAGRLFDVGTPPGLIDSVRANALQIACYKVCGRVGEWRTSGRACAPALAQCACTSTPARQARPSSSCGPSSPNTPAARRRDRAPAVRVSGHAAAAPFPAGPPQATAPLSAGCQGMWRCRRLGWWGACARPPPARPPTYGVAAHLMHALA